MPGEHLTWEAFETILWLRAVKAFNELCAKGYLNDFEFQPQAAHSVFDTYSKLRDQFKSKIGSEENYIDRHRIAAVMTIAILQVRPLQVTNQNLKKPVFYSAINEHFALTAAVVVLYLFLYKEFSGDKKKQELLNKHGLKFPKTNHGNFRDNTAKAFCQFDQNNHIDAFSILNLATLYFLFELNALKALFEGR